MGRTRKDNIKAVRAVLEGIALILLLVVIIRALFTFTKYEPFDTASVSADTTSGIVALSYFGVDREGSETLISTARLDEQLRTLYEQGFVTVTQDDIVDYYKNGTPLPEKALFLMFEDGRRDTSIFAEKILEKYNFKASMLTYAEKFEIDDPKFLSASDLLEMEKSTFWELGTNGYRLFYINVFDRYGYYLGELSTLEYAMMTQYLGRDYNHYLMDYIRDKYGVPKESYDAMTARIGADYEGMQREYTDKVGKLPGLYSIMHSNTGKFGNNDRVSETNAEWIYQLFDLNFNREGFCFNSRDDGHTVYDLTRMQPQSYWYINHLLMRVKFDSGLPIQFIPGDEEEYANWDVLQGALECKPEKLVVTSEPESDGLIALKNYTFADGQVDLELTGNKFGSQTVYLRADDAVTNAVFVSVENNVLTVGEASGASREALFELNLDKLDGVQYDSVEEDEKAARVGEMTALARYGADVSEISEYTRQAREASTWQTHSVEEGAEAYVPDIDIHDAGHRKLSIVLNGPTVSVTVDGKPAAEVTVSNTRAGRLGFGTRWGGFGWSQRNLADDVYDGVIEKLSIRTLPDAKGKSELIYDDLLHGLAKAGRVAATIWKNVINWFIKYL